MKTVVINVDARHPERKALLPAAEALRKGELVAFPTETVYGLGADALNPHAVSEIFRVKGRPPDNPLIVHVAKREHIDQFVKHVTALANMLLDAFSPGPLTLVLPRSNRVPDLVTAGLDTVAIRLPAHPVSRCLLELFSGGVAAPSANRSGKPSPTQAWHVLEDLDGLISTVVDAGPCQYGLESTVVDATGDRLIILRPGSITASDIRRVTGQEPLQDQKRQSVQGLLAEPIGPARSPGVKYRHYAPRARVVIADIRDQNLSSLVKAWCEKGVRVGVFASRQSLGQLGCLCPDLSTIDRVAFLTRTAQSPACCSVTYGPDPDPVQAGSALYDALRLMDSYSMDVIIAEGLPEHGVGEAYMNRLKKASEQEVNE